MINKKLQIYFTVSHIPDPLLRHSTSQLSRLDSILSMPGKHVRSKSVGNEKEKVFLLSSIVVKCFLRLDDS